uniref:tRNA (uracil(54)-C(5))-methyltransferase n=1 Tax=Parastrongyloides trichosuri TaxID=131310 RepID=A0A0N4ZT35_PARTI
MDSNSTASNNSEGIFAVPQLPSNMLTSIPGPSSDTQPGLAPRIRKRKFGGAKIQPSRVKKVMQSDEDIGRMMASVPVAIGRAMEHFCEKFLEATSRCVNASSSRTMNPSHMKHAILVNPQFQFLSNIMKDIPIPKNIDSNAASVPCSPTTPIAQFHPQFQQDIQQNTNLIVTSPTDVTDSNNSKPKRGRPKKMKLNSTDCNYMNGIFVQPSPIEGSTSQIIMKEDNNQSEESFRIKIMRLPPFMGHGQIKKLMTSKLNGMEFRKLKYNKKVCYLSLTNEEDVEKALQILDKMVIKGNQIEVSRTGEVPDSRKVIKEKAGFDPNVDVRDIVTPLHNLSYEEQLEKKNEASKGVLKTLISNLNKLEVDGTNIKLENILPSPKSEEYRNKNEFNIGYDKDSNPCIGYTGGRYMDGKRIQLPIYTCTHLTSNTKAIVKILEDYVKNSDMPIFNEMTNEGFWKMITVRDFIQDTMITVTTYPQPPEMDEKINKIKQDIADLFFKNIKDFKNQNSHVSSIYWQVHKDSFDPKIYTHVAGTPYVYETILNTRFRLGPASFFQTNSYGANVLFKTIADFAGATKVVDLPDDRNFLFLDICCGAGAISLAIYNQIIKKYPKIGKSQKMALVGVEIVPEAINDAIKNAHENAIDEKICKFVAGSAETIFKCMSKYMPEGFILSNESTDIVGVLDPPRAGINDSVIISIRKLVSMKRLVYVSCDPKAASKNLVDLCRDTSNKFEGLPFEIKTIQPVDMFPQTNHFEWVILLERN